MDESMIPDNNSFTNMIKGLFVVLILIFLSAVSITMVAFSISYLTEPAEKRKFIMQCVEFKTSGECLLLLKEIEKDE